MRAELEWVIGAPTAAGFHEDDSGIAFLAVRLWPVVRSFLALLLRLALVGEHALDKICVVSHIRPGVRMNGKLGGGDVRYKAHGLLTFDAQAL